MGRVPLLDAALTRSVIGAFFDVYNALGFGFLEHVYVMALERELLARGHAVAREVSIRVTYKGQELASQRLYMIVDGRLVVETKSTYELHRAASRQLYNYLRATNLEVGLLLHFGPEPKFHRLINRHDAFDPARRPSAPHRSDPFDPSPPSHPRHPSSEGPPGRASADPSDDGSAG